MAALPQRHAIARAMAAIAWTLRVRCAESKTPAYERRGLVVEADVAPLDGGPAGWTLRRPPR